MKKVLTFSLVIIIFLSLVACSDNSQNPKTAIEELNEDEKVLFEALKVMSNDFFEPGEVTLLEVGDYGGSIYSGLSNPCGRGEHHSVTVRLQGENRVGGTLSDYYTVRLDTLPESIVDNVGTAIRKEAENDCKEHWDDCTSWEYPRSDFSSRTEYKSFLEDVYYADDFCTEEEANKLIGKYINDKDDTIEVSAEEKYNIAKINKALKYYWNERLGKN